MNTEILLVLVGLITSIISSTIGVGAAIIILPFASIILPVKQAIALTNVYFIALALSKVVVFRKFIRWDVTRDITIGALPAAIVGSYVLIATESMVLKRILGAVILFTVLISYLPKIKQLRIPRPALIFSGGAYGFFSAMIGDGSIIKALVFNHLGIVKEHFIATMGMTALIINLVKAGIYTKFQLLSVADIPVIMGLILAAMGGAYIGKLWVGKINGDAFKTIITISVVLMALQLLFF